MSCEEVSGSAVNVAVLRGDTMRLVVEFGSNGQEPTDVSGWTWKCQLRDAADVEVAQIVIDETDAVIGVLGLSLDETTTGALPVADYAWDLEANDGSDVRTLLVGKLRIKEDVSR